MSFIYVTADTIGTETGGGLVTHHESEALRSLGPCEVWGREHLTGGSDPWGWDETALKNCMVNSQMLFGHYPRVCHIYSGTFGRTVGWLKTFGTKISYTIAAHDRHVSRREHEQLGLPFPYKHLTDEVEWQKYILGYALADVIVAPSSVAARTIRAYGPEFENKDIRVIPHGCEIPETVAPLPNRFTVGYMGSYGADKGVRYLLAAWKQLNYRDATLVLAGRDSTSPWVSHLIDRFGGGNITRVGWVDNVSIFYDSISLYCQPSATEGWGIEVTEAMAHGRPVVCSDGAGASDVVPKGGMKVDSFVVPACDVTALAESIDLRRTAVAFPEAWRTLAEKYSWDRIRQQYVQMWQSLLQQP